MNSVALFIPCLVDQLLPEIGDATARVLSAQGLAVHYDPRQTCCGQPAHNAGHAAEATRLAARALKLFARWDCDAIVAPSGSCVSMLKGHADELPLPPDARTAWREVRGRLFELTEFLAGPLADRPVTGAYPRRLAYHASCHLMRELGVDQAPCELLGRLEGVELVPLRDADVCCGFGGTFSAKQPELSIRMGREKLASFVACGAEELVLADAGCLLQVRGVLKAAGVPGRVRHVAEVLADAMEGR